MKVLIISHNPIMTVDSMGKTFLSLFSAFAPSELCQLYVYPSIPDVKRCSSYFRLTDKEVLKSLFGKRAGRTIADEEIEHAKTAMFEDDKDESLYRNPKNKKPARMLLRDVMWSLGHWYNKRLKAWLAEQQPTCIFVAPGTAKFLYDVALKIAKKYDLPIVTYICDDYYFVERTGSPLKRLQVRLLQRKIERLMKRTSRIVSICDAISENYGEKFDVPTTTVMTGSSFSTEEASRFFSEDLHAENALAYLGNVRCNRYKSLLLIGQALQRFNETHGTQHRLNVYTSEKDEEILNALKSVDTIRLCGFISGDLFSSTLCSAEVLVHTESFDKDMIELVKNSVSTKIADSLASGRKFLAFGSEQLASIQYLQKNGLAYVATSEAELDEALCRALTDESHAVTDKAKAFAQQNHDANRNSETLHGVFEALNSANQRP